MLFPLSILIIAGRLLTLVSSFPKIFKSKVSFSSWNADDHVSLSGAIFPKQVFRDIFFYLGNTVNNLKLLAFWLRKMPTVSDQLQWVEPEIHHSSSATNLYCSTEDFNMKPIDESLTAARHMWNPHCRSDVCVHSHVLSSHNIPRLSQSLLQELNKPKLD